MFRFRFSLRTLLVAVFCTATIASYFGWRFRWSELQSRIVQEISYRGGTVYVGANDTKKVVFSQHSPNESCGVKCLSAPLAGSPSTFTDEDLPLLTQLYRLRVVEFTDSKVSPPAVEQFRSTHPDLLVNP